MNKHLNNPFNPTNQIHMNNIEQGDINENQVLEWLNKKNNLYIKDTSDRDRAPMDFINENDKIKIELKSSNYNSSELSELMISASKFQEMLNDKSNTKYVYYLMKDGLFGWKFDPQKFSTDCRKDISIRTDRGRNEHLLVIKILTKKFIKITDEIKCISVVDDDDEECLL